MNKKNNYFLFFLIFIVTFSYGIFQARELLRGPNITVTYPKDGETINERIFTVTGNTKNVTHIKINGKEITMDTTGKFSETLIAPYGYGIIIIEATNRFGKQIKKEIKFMGTQKSV